MAVEKQSVAQNQMTAPSVALPTQQVIATQQVTATQQQVTAAQIYLEAQETLLPRKAESVHQYSLRSKTRRESIPNVASNVNQFFHSFVFNRKFNLTKFSFRLMNSAL
jgi:predicted peptidase